MRLICRLLLVMIMLTHGYPRVLWAQATLPLDLEPPVIVFEEQKSGVAGSDQLFTVDVTDDRRVTSVVLYYRFASDPEFTSAPMDGEVGTSIYTRTVQTTAADPRNLEYYIQAEDLAGNRSIKGFVFDPLVRTLTADASPTTTVSGESSGGFDRRILWGLAGLLVIALIAGASGGDSGGSTNNTGGGPITIDVNEVP